jgi:hypothetical protein
MGRPKTISRNYAEIIQKRHMQKNIIVHLLYCTIFRNLDSHMWFYISISILCREGHLEEALHIFAYLKTHDRSAVVFDDSTPLFDESRFIQCDWTEYYPDAHEPEPPRAPELRGNSVTTTCFVDADHAGCQETRRSHRIACGVVVAHYWPRFENLCKHMCDQCVSYV